MSPFLFRLALLGTFPKEEGLDPGNLEGIATPAYALVRNDMVDDNLKISGVDFSTTL